MRWPYNVNPNFVFIYKLYKKLKQVGGLEEYFRSVNGPLSRLIFKFHSGTHGLFEELGKEFVENVLFEHASYDSQKHF